MKKAFKISAFLFKWSMRLYPPFFFMRIKVKEVSKDFKYIKVEIAKSIFNKNLSGTMFGGTLFAASDPFFALMYWQNFAHQYNMKVRVWLKSAEIKYKKPAIGKIYIDFKLTQEDVEQAKKDLAEFGKHNKTHQVELKNKKNEVCAVVDLVTYVGKS